jgi:hypothetical protein
MFVERVTAIGERFFSGHSFTLIVAPAIADFEFDRQNGSRAYGYLAVLRAMAGAAREDITRDPGGTLTFLALALIPAGYYAFLFLLLLPPLRDTPAADTLLLLGAFTLALSTTTAVICYWPDPLPDRTPPETP